MAQLIENKDRIIEAFADIRSSIVNKGVVPTGDVSTYSQSILDIPQGYEGASALRMVLLGTFYWTGTASSSTSGSFTLNTGGRNYFVQVGAKNRCIVGGTFCIVTGSCLIGNTDAHVTTTVEKSTSEVLSQSTGDRNLVGASFEKVPLYVDDEIFVRGTTTGVTSQAQKNHYALLYVLLGD